MIISASVSPVQCCDLVRCGVPGARMSIYTKAAEIKHKNISGRDRNSVDTDDKNETEYSQLYMEHEIVIMWIF